MNLEVNQNNFKKYAIPASKLIFSAILFILYIIILIGVPFIFEKISKEWFWWLFFIWFVLFGMSFFVYMQFWMNIFVYPIRKWILLKIRCCDCGFVLDKCDYAFRGIDSSHFLSFAVACKGCQKVFFLETGVFDKTLKFSSDKQGLWIKNYEKKYFPKKIKKTFL